MNADFWFELAAFSRVLELQELPYEAVVANRLAHDLLDGLNSPSVLKGQMVVLQALLDRGNVPLPRQMLPIRQSLNHATLGRKRRRIAPANSYTLQIYAAAFFAFGYTLQSENLLVLAELVAHAARGMETPDFWMAKGELLAVHDLLVASQRLDLAAQLVRLVDELTIW